jgi:hypothetical protein
MVLRRIFGPRRDDRMTGGWRGLHSEELYNLYPATSIIRMVESRAMRCAWNVVRTEIKRNAYGLLVRKPEGMIPIGRPRCRWINNINMYLRGIWGYAVA